jgi:LysM repeat protein
MKVRLLSIVVLLAVLLAGFSFPTETQASACTPVYHVVKPGQNLTQIARYYGVSVQAIVNANNLWNPNLIYSGQHLLIPVPCQQPAPPPPSTSCTTIHVVKRGEYLKVIAARYGTTVTAIVNLNGIKNPNLIYPGQRLRIPVKCQPAPKPTPTPKPGTTGPWTGQYWTNRYLSGTPKFTANYARVNFNWGTKGPGSGVASTNFSARFVRTRYLDGGTYRFYVQVDDGVRVWVDNVLIIDQWHDSAPTLYTADRQLSSGNHTFQIDYYQNQGAAQVVFWPELVDGKAAWKADFFNNKNLSGDPSAVRHYNAIDFNWGKNAPLAGITADFFSIRFTGEFYFVGGQYQFTATVDDGVRIYLDDTLIMDQWHMTSVRTYNVNVDVSEGNHRLKVEYFENMGDAVCKVRWTQR